MEREIEAWRWDTHRDRGLEVGLSPILTFMMKWDSFVSAGWYRGFILKNPNAKVGCLLCMHSHTHAHTHTHTHTPVISLP